MMEISVKVLYSISLTCSLIALSDQTYREPPETYDDIQYQQKITATSRCTSVTSGCSSDICTNVITSIPNPTNITALLSCYVSKNDLNFNVPNDVQSTNILYVNKTTENCTRQIGVSVSAGTGYTIGFWIYLDKLENSFGSSAQLFKINNISISIGFSKQLLINEELDANSMLLSIRRWYYIVLRYEKGGQASVIINGERNTGLSYSLNRVLPDSPSFINFNPSTTGSFYMADLNFYTDYLTEIDIKKIFNSGYTTDIGNPNCRCPSFFADFTPYDAEGLYCQEPFDDGANKALRLKPEGHLPVFAIDTNDTTSWRSRNLATNIQLESLTITFKQLYMIEEVKIKSTGAKPQIIKIELIRQNSQSEEYEDTGTQLVNDYFTLNLRRDFTPGLTSNRSTIEKMVANSVKITLSGRADSQLYYEIPEIQIKGRCYCSGVTASCSHDILSHNYTCNSCTLNSSGQNCENCNTGSYVPQEDFGCTASCNCYRDGTNGSSNVCDVDGGQCNCKRNVELQQCNKCKFFTYNLNGSNPDGCQRCNCDRYGTHSCDESNGACRCKNNVEPGNCASCINNYFGRNRPGGCEPCGCSVKGTLRGSTQTCDEFTGKCTCKENVGGDKCTECKNEFYNLTIDNTVGCESCECSNRGSHDNICNKTTGQCRCILNLSQYTNLCSNGACRRCEPKSDGRLDPAFGPISGGTKVRLTGIHFGNNKTNVDIRIGQSYLTVTEINDTSLEFETVLHQTGNQEVKIQFLNLHFGDVTRQPADLGPYTFSYMPNPTITKVNSATTFKSGGCAVSISGTALNSVAYPKLIVYNEQQTQELQRKDCSPSGDGISLRCDSPNTSSVGTFKYGLYLDGFPTYRNLSGMFNDNSIKIIEDPMVNQAQGDKVFKPVFGSTFSIRGDQLDAACSMSDYSVDCGPEVKCSVVSISSTEVVCKPDVSFPGPGVTVRLQLMIGEKSHLAQEIEFMSFWSTTEFIGIVIGAVVFIALVVVFIVLCQCCRNRRDKKNIDMESNRVQSDGNLRLSTFDTDNTPLVNGNKEMPRQPAKPNPYVGITMDKENWENFIHRLNESIRKQLEFSKINMADIEPGRICTNKGEHIRIIDGNFKVGTSNYLAGRPAKIKTLVKEYSTFDSGLLPQWISSGIQECLKFRDCVNDNFLAMKGVATDENRMFILYPSYHRIFKDYLNDKAITNTVRELMEFALYAADGLKYLHDEGIVHKDLATRNCIITESKIVKLTDPSFSWDLYPEEYMYDERRERYLPVRWMALESLKAGFYNKDSDIWTFGVVMWEIMFESNSLPYPEITDNTEIKDHIDSGYRLGKSEETPESLHNLMLQCWEADSEKRVNIETLISTLQKMVDPDNFGQTGLYINEDDLYQNTSFTNEGFVN